MKSLSEEREREKLQTRSVSIESEEEYEEEEDESEEDQCGGGGDVNVRIRPNSNFLRRYVGGVERSNEKMPIVAVPQLSQESIEDKSEFIQSLKGICLVRL